MAGFGSQIKKLLGFQRGGDPLAAIKNLPLAEGSFVVIDLETTGLDAKKDLILSFGGVKISNGAIIVGESLEQLFKESEATLNESVKIHGILKSSMENGHNTKEALERIHAFIGEHIVVGHHIDFDFQMLKNALMTHLQLELNNPKLDTALLAIRLEKGSFSDTILKGEYSLDSLCKRYNIETFDRHTAPGDAFLTAQLFIQLLRIAEEKGIKTMGKLLEKRTGGLI